VSIDIAGSGEAVESSDPSIRYKPRVTGRVAYTVSGEGRPHIATRRVGDQIVVRDLVSGAEGTGPTYLDALWAYRRGVQGTD
jgi:hypothetical protein